MNWIDISQYDYGDTCHDVLLRVEYVGMSEPVYTMGYVHGGDVMWSSCFAGQDCPLCALYEIGKGEIAAVYYIDPREILK